MLFLLFLAFCYTVMKDGHADNQNVDVRLREGFFGLAIHRRSIDNTQPPFFVQLRPQGNEAPVSMYCYPETTMNAPLSGQPFVSKPPPIPNMYPSSPVVNYLQGHQDGRPLYVVPSAAYHLLPGGAPPRVGQDLAPPSPGFGSISGEEMKKATEKGNNVYPLRPSIVHARNALQGSFAKVLCVKRKDFGKCSDETTTKDKGNPKIETPTKKPTKKPEDSEEDFY